MAITTFKRYELKFSITKEQLDQILPRLLEYMELDEHCVNGNEYTIYNVYYDTLNSDVIRENSSKPRYKEKMRLRSYTPVQNADDKVFMELKKKENGIGNKRRIKMKLGEVDDLINHAKPPSVEGYHANQVVKEILYYISLYPVQPKVYLQYDRLALFGKDDKNFRMTFDRNIRTRRENFAFGASESDEILLPSESYIMEVKILGAIPLWLTSILSELKLYKKGFSKYGTEWERKTIDRKIPYYLTDGNGEINADFVSTANYYQVK